MSVFQRFGPLYEHTVQCTNTSAHHDSCRSSQAQSTRACNSQHTQGTTKRVLDNYFVRVHSNSICTLEPWNHIIRYYMRDLILLSKYITRSTGCKSDTSSPSKNSYKIFSNERKSWAIKAKIMRNYPTKISQASYQLKLIIFIIIYEFLFEDGTKKPKHGLDYGRSWKQRFIWKDPRYYFKFWHTHRCLSKNKKMIVIYTYEWNPLKIRISDSYPD